MSNRRSSAWGAWLIPRRVLIPARSTLIQRAGVAVSAGFPSPAEDYYDGPIDLTTHLVPHPAATFVVRVAGWSMVGAGIHDGDELLVDRTLPIVDGRVVVAIVDGEFTVKRLRHRDGQVHLVAEHPDYPDIDVTSGDVQVWGVVRTVIHHV